MLTDCIVKFLNFNFFQILKIRYFLNFRKPLNFWILKIRCFQISVIFQILKNRWYSIFKNPLKRKNITKNFPSILNQANLTFVDTKMGPGHPSIFIVFCQTILYLFEEDRIDHHHYFNNSLLFSSKTPKKNDTVFEVTLIFTCTQTDICVTTSSFLLLCISFRLHFDYTVNMSLIFFNRQLFLYVCIKILHVQSLTILKCFISWIFLKKGNILS